MQHRSPKRRHQSRCRPTSWKFWWRVSRSTPTSWSRYLPASLYPLQIVQAARYLDGWRKTSLKPKEDWDGSVISLLNYPEVVRMMSDDLDWTQSLGDALANQQKDVLVAIQQVRDKAVANGIIKSDDKIEVVESGTMSSFSRQRRDDLCAGV